MFARMLVKKAGLGRPLSDPARLFFVLNLECLLRITYDCFLTVQKSCFVNFKHVSGTHHCCVKYQWRKDKKSRQCKANV